MENTTKNVASKSWFDSIVDAACVAVYVAVGTGVVAYETVDQIIVPAVTDAVKYTADKGEKFCKEQVVPAVDAARERGRAVMAGDKVPATVN